MFKLKMPIVMLGSPCCDIKELEKSTPEIEFAEDMRVVPISPGRGQEPFFFILRRGDAEAIMSCRTALVTWPVTRVQEYAMVRRYWPRMGYLWGREVIGTHLVPPPHTETPLTIVNVPVQGQHKFLPDMFGFRSIIKALERKHLASILDEYVRAAKENFLLFEKEAKSAYQELVDALDAMEPERIKRMTNRFGVTIEGEPKGWPCK